MRKISYTFYIDPDLLHLVEERARNKTSVSEFIRQALYNAVNYKPEVREGKGNVEEFFKNRK